MSKLTDCTMWSVSLLVLLIINQFFCKAYVALLPIFCFIVRAIIVAQCLLQTTLVLHPVLKAIHNDMHMQMTNEQNIICYKVKVNFNFFFIKITEI